MEALKCIETRRSVRKYSDAPVSRETLEALVSAASWAPSWKNCQPARYTAVLAPELRGKIAASCVMDHPGNQRIITGCAALIVLSVVHGRSGFERDGSFSTSKEDRWEVFDAGIAAQTLCLAAHDMGLGTVIMGIFDEEKLAAALPLPEGEKAAALIALGYPEGEAAAPARKSADILLRIK